jgi:hypothetical protein
MTTKLTKSQKRWGAQRWGMHSELSVRHRTRHEIRL